MHASRGIRKTHRKTKTGCKTCRQRRVKCDEEKPECFMCRRRGVDCLWDANAVIAPASQNSPSSSSSDSSSLSRARGASNSPRVPGPSAQIVRTNGAAMMDMLGIELMHYYMVHTSMSLLSTPDPNGIECLHILGPRAALHFSPLLNIIFALTCMHIHIAERDFAGTRSERDYLSLADHFIKESLQAIPSDYNPQRNIEYDYDEREPAFLLFSFIALLTMCHPNFRLDAYEPCPYVDSAYLFSDHPLAWVAAARFFQLQMMEHWDPWSPKERPVIHPGPILIEPPAESLHYHNLLPFPHLLQFIHSPGAPDASELEQSVANHGGPIRAGRVYEEAVRQLKMLWNVSFEPHQQQLKMAMWPVAMSQEFYEFIMEKRPRALVIFAHYCTLLGQFPDKWVIINRGKPDTRAILKILEDQPEWISWMGVPLAQLNAPEGKDRAIPREIRHAALC